MTPDYIDFLGNPVAVGDLYIHPVGAGSSSATLNFGKIEEIIPIVKINNGYRDIWTLQEYVGKPNPTEYRPFGRWDDNDYRNPNRKWSPTPGLSYVIRSRGIDREWVNRDLDYYDSRACAWRWSEGKRGKIIRNIDRLVVVTNTMGHPWIDRVAEADTLGFGAE